MNFFYFKEPRWKHRSNRVYFTLFFFVLSLFLECRADPLTIRVVISYVEEILLRIENNGDKNAHMSTYVMF